MKLDSLNIREIAHWNICTQNIWNTSQFSLETLSLLIAYKFMSKCQTQSCLKIQQDVNYVKKNIFFIYLKEVLINTNLCWLSESLKLRES